MRCSSSRIGSAVLSGWAILAAAVAIWGCAEQRPPIDRVQANALAKSFFVGEKLADIEDDPEFYMRGTVIDVGYGAAQDLLFTSSWAMPISRISWEITENYLNARLGYERIQGTDSKGQKFDGLRKKTSNDGQVVASFQILSHFDIKRSYNPTTGEELNIVEENTTDRPWYERDHFRVDWSKNLSTDAYDFDTLSQMGLYGAIEWEPLSYYVADPNDDYAPHFDTADNYFDITTKAFAKPQMIDLSSLGWGIDKFPACMLPGEFAGGTYPYANCNPVEVTLRHSFRKVTDTDYEPFDQDGLRFQAFGAFNFNYRFGYERNYGMVDDRWFRFQSRYNLWERSHYYQDAEKMTGEVKCASYATSVEPTGDAMADANRDSDRNGTADECEAVTEKAGAGGSQCDVFKGKCTLPLRVRKEKTIPWYVNGDTDEDLFEATMWATQEWNIGMLTAVQVGRLVECRRTGGSDCDSRFPMWSGQQDDYDDAVEVYREVESCRRDQGWDNGECDALADSLAAGLANERGGEDANVVAIRELVKKQPILVLCHNPVTDKDHPACGKPGLAPRFGDLRYNNVMAIEKPQTPSAWGIMVDGDDPVTGEKVAASINIWTHVTDTAVQQLVDLVRYINGELNTADITDGKYVRDWVQASRNIASGKGALLSKQEVAQRLAAASRLTPEQFSKRTQTPPSKEVRAMVAKMQHELRDVAASADVPSAVQAEVQARMNLARGTPTEAALLNPAMLQLGGAAATGLPLAGPVLDSVSPFALGNPKLRAQLRQLRENAIAKRGACILSQAPEPTALTGIADVLKHKFPALDGESQAQKHARYQAMLRYARRKYHYAVIAHEMGHSVGHRHNFVSSSGPLFYRPQYWQLRTKNGEVTKACSDATAEGASCVGPRYFDPLTSEEQDQLIWMFMQSTAMDYPGDVSQDMIGLGIWDYAGARFFYGDTVAVYADPNIQDGTRVGAGITDITDTFGGLVGIKYSVSDGGELTEFHYSQLQNEYGVIGGCYSVSPRQPSWWNAEKDGPWSALLDGHYVTVGGDYKKCRQMPVDYAAWRDLRQPGDEEISGSGYNRDRGPSVQQLSDGTTRLRVPYHFASDRWADLGNVSVFRHDNGADPYEQAMFLIMGQEDRHIFDNFRRNRASFDVRAAADRSFSRYNEKLVNLASGMAFYTTIYERWATQSGYTFDSLFPYIANQSLKDNMLAASVVFDHLTRQLARPEDGEHYQLDAYFEDPVLRSMKDADGSTYDKPWLIIIPNGTTGYLKDVGIGGHPLENALDETKGEYATDYTINAGSYYDKINTIIHLSISEDRFISQSRGDFYDARFRANGMADLYPDGYRRLVANALTNDRAVLAPHLAADSSGRPIRDINADTSRDPLATGYPVRPVGWSSFWPKAGPSICFPSDSRNVCRGPDGSQDDFHPDMPQYLAAVDPQVGWEVQKFVIAWVLAYIPANWKSQWLDMMKIYRLGPDSPPDFENRIEWQDPTSGQIYYAKTYGRECLFGTGASCSGGKLVEKGIAARVLEYANSLATRGYVLDTNACKGTALYPAGQSEHGRPCLKYQPDGTAIVKTDPAVCAFDEDGRNCRPRPTCDQNVDPSCTPLSIYDNHFAFDLREYKSVPDYLWESLIRFELGSPSELGLYP